MWLTISSNSSRAKAVLATSTRSATSRTLLFFMIALRRFFIFTLFLFFFLFLVLMDVHTGHAELAAQLAQLVHIDLAHDVDHGKLPGLGRQNGHSEDLVGTGVFHDVNLID